MQRLGEKPLQPLWWGLEGSKHCSCRGDLRGWLQSLGPGERLTHQGPEGSPRGEAGSVGAWAKVGRAGGEGREGRGSRTLRAVWEYLFGDVRCSGGSYTWP